MPNRNKRFEFFTLLLFLVATGLMLTNGFTERIFAQEQSEPDIFEEIEPIGEVLGEILHSYYQEPDIEKIVEGALRGMMFSLDRHSAFIPPQSYRDMTEDTEGEFEGIGVHIQQNDNGAIVIVQPMPGSPAIEEGVKPGDIIYKIEGVETEGMTTMDAAQRIKGPKGTIVNITVLRRDPDSNLGYEELDFKIKRGKIPIESVKEARVFEGGIGYMRVTDFRKNTDDEMRDYIRELSDDGMKSLILDLRWNPGGLLTASKEMVELFVPKNTKVTYTKGRKSGTGGATDNMVLYTDKDPVVPADFPVIVLVNDLTASSSEIVTGAMQFYARAIVIGQKTYGKGSVQTIIPLRRPRNSALRLTTALYYTPADVTINGQGILPDVEVDMGSSNDPNSQNTKLYYQLMAGFQSDPSRKDQHVHGIVSQMPEDDETVVDLPLQKAIEILEENPVFTDVIKKFHRDTSETQIAAAPEVKEAS